MLSYFTTPLDVRMYDRSITSTVRNDNELNFLVQRATFTILGFLYPIYGTSDSSFTTTPFGSPICVPFYENTDDSGILNTGTGNLASVTINSTAETETWVITFTSSTAFGLVGGNTGSDGTGSTASNFTSTSGDITISSTKWSGTPSSGDRFFFSSYHIKPPLVAIATILASAIAIQGVHVGAFPDRVATSVGLYDEAYKLLEKISNPYVPGGIWLDSLAMPTNAPLEMPYDIGTSGNDLTDYASSELRSYAVSDWPWQALAYWM